MVCTTKKLINLLAMISVILVLSSCTAGGGGDGVIHDGRGIAVSAKPPLARIVSTAPNLTTIMVSIGQGQRLAGISDLCPQPDPARPLPRIGSLIGPDAERISALSPDCVIASYEGNPPQMADTMRALKIPFYVARIDSLASLEKTMLDLELLACGTNSEALRTSISNLRSAIIGRLAGKRIFFQIGTTTEAWTFGRNTLVHDALVLAGASNLGSGRPGNFPRFDAETMASLNPDIVVFLTGHNKQRDEAFWKRYAPRARLLALDPALFEQPGPRIAEGIQALARP